MVGLHVLPALPVACPLIAAALLAGLRRWLPRLVIDGVAAFTTLLNVLFCLDLLHLSASHNIVYWFGNWFPRGRMALGIGFSIDPIGASLAALASFLTLLGIIYSWCNMESGRNYFQPLMLIFLAAMSGFVLTADLFNLFVFFELMSTAAFALCGLKVLEPEPLQGAFNFAITNTIGAFFVLTGIAFLYGATGALNLAQIGAELGARHDALVTTACLFIVGGFFVKAAIVPFHFWLPDAHSVAPTPASVLFSGIMVELGLYAVLRILVTLFGSSFLLGSLPLKSTFAVMGAATALWGGMMCFAEHHLKRILAFSTISHVGLMLLAISIGSAQAVAGWFIYLLGHGLVKSSLFFTAGILLHRFRTISEPALFGRARSLRIAAVLWFVGGCALAALPPFATSLGEGMITDSTDGWLKFLFHGLFLFSGVFTGGAVLRVFVRVFLGWGDRGPQDRSSSLDEAPETDDNYRMHWRLGIPPTACLMAAAALAFAPGVGSFSFHAAARFLSQQTYAAAIYGRATRVIAQMPSPAESAIISGSVAVLLAALLACWAVFHETFPRWLRWPSHLEGSMRWARQLQSGHPGDYVAWSLVGMGFLGVMLYALR